MELLERVEALAMAEEALAQAQAGRGGVLLVSGEAGIGKTSLIARLLTLARPRHLRLLLGGCEDLHSPQPLGPLHEMARSGLPEVQALLARHAPASEVFAAMLRLLDTPHQPTLLVFEDLHWADEATLDLVKHLGRRIVNLPVLLLLSYRDDELGDTHPLARVLGDLPAPSRRQIALAPLSAEAVATLCLAAGRPDALQAAGLHEATAGNPFYVTEVLASGVGGEGVPSSVRAAVHTRVRRLDTAAREVLSALCVVPGSVDIALVQALLPGQGEAVDTCVAKGLLVVRGGALAFRHELARRAVLDRLTPMLRRERNAAVLAALLAGGGMPASLASLAHHAAEAGDAARLLEFAPAAAAQAAAVGAHRQAARLLAAALRVAAGAPAAQQAQLHESWSYEAGLALGMDAEVIAARHRAIALWRELGRVDKVGLNLRWLSRLHWYQGDAMLAERYAAEAVEVLQPHPPGPELAWAYAVQAQLQMLQDRLEPTRDWGARAIELATRLNEREALCHALNSVGTAELFAGHAQGQAKLERSLGIAREDGFHEQAARVYTNVAEQAVVFKDFARAETWLAEGIAFDRRYDLDAWTPYLVGWQAQLRLEQGRYAEALAIAQEVLAAPRLTAIVRLPALSVRACVLARRGDEGATAALDEALAQARRTEEFPRVLPLTLARAEALWLDGDVAAAAALLRPLASQPELGGNPWTAGAFAVWCRRCGEEGAAGGTMAEPWLLELQNRPADAAAAWSRLGLPFEAALAQLRQAGAGQDAAHALAEAARTLLAIGAAPALARVQALAHELGLPAPQRRGPYAAARAHPKGLTGREQQVLALLAEGLSNADIGRQLSLGSRTVEHHVSAVLAKLGAEGRAQAIAMAWREGLF